MDSCIFIDGIALWVLLVLAVVIASCIIGLGCSYINSQREVFKKDTEIKRLRAENKELRYRYNRLETVYYRDTYKLPEVT